MEYDAKLLSKAYNLNIAVQKIRQESIQKFAALMKWNNGEDVVMDIGCGPGDTTHKDLLPAIPEVKTIIAMDLLPAMINFAKLHNFHPKIEYHVADITESITLERWMGKISHTFSMFCLQRIEDQEGAFKNIFSLLKENGEAGLLFMLSDTLYTCYDDIINSPKWKIIEDTHTDVPKSHTKNYGSEHYKGILERIGFEVLVCEDWYTDFTFEEDDHAKA